MTLTFKPALHRLVLLGLAAALLGACHGEGAAGGTSQPA